MGYANPIEAMGAEHFADRAKAAGVDGVLVVDCPPEEAQSLVKLLDARALDTIFLLSPTTRDARLKQVGQLGRGYLYYVSLKGVTGAANIDTTEVAQRVNHIKTFTGLPVGVGFGIRDAASAKSVAQVADAVVIGSRLVQEIIDAGVDAPARVQALLASIRAAMDTLVKTKAA
jgi:tryptophan synthase alpha chain